MGLPAAAALTCIYVRTKKANAETKDAVHIKCTYWRGICSGLLKMRGRTMYSKTCVYSYMHGHSLRWSIWVCGVMQCMTTPFVRSLVVACDTFKMDTGYVGRCRCG
jgi:hypothetical protein